MSMKRTGCGSILLLLLCLPVLGYAAQETLFTDGEPPEDREAMQALEGTQWQIDAGGSMYADLQCFLSDREVLCDWDGWEESHPGEARIAAYSVSRYDSAWNLFWRDVPYMITYTDVDGDKHRYGLEFDADELNLVTGEGGGGFIPYQGDENRVVDGVIQARMKQREGAVWAVVNNPNPADRLHLRTKPDRKSESLGKFYNRTPVRVLETRGEWVLVTVGGTGMMEGWMMKKYLAFGDAMADVACAFPQMQHIALYRETGVPVEYIPKVTDQKPAFIDEGDAYIVGVYGDEWYILYDPASGRVGYALQSLFCAGNG